MDSSEIITGLLWIGSTPSPTDLVELKKQLGTSLVVLDLNRNTEEENWCRQLGVAYDVRVPQVEDSPTLPLSKLRLIARIIDEHLSARRKVFMHCTAGRGRSPTCAAAYLIHGGMSLSEARKFVSEKRAVWIGNDAGYASSLEEFAKMQEIAHSSG